MSRKARAWRSRAKFLYQSNPHIADGHPQLADCGAHFATDWSNTQNARFVRDDSLLKRLGKIKVVDGLSSDSSVRDVLYQTWAMTAGFKRHANYKVSPLRATLIDITALPWGLAPLPPSTCTTP